MRKSTPFAWRLRTSRHGAKPQGRKPGGLTSVSTPAMSVLPRRRHRETQRSWIRQKLASRSLQACSSSPLDADQASQQLLQLLRRHLLCGWHYTLKQRARVFVGSLSGFMGREELRWGVIAELEIGLAGSKTSRAAAGRQWDWRQHCIPRLSCYRECAARRNAQSFSRRVAHQANVMQYMQFHSCYETCIRCTSQLCL